MKVLSSWYGFGWGPALVTRMSSFTRKDHGKERTSICIGIDTGFVVPESYSYRGGRENTHIAPGTHKHSLHVYISQTGQSVRCYLDGQEMFTEIQRSKRKHV
jgi:hypothetical protein